MRTDPPIPENELTGKPVGQVLTKRRDLIRKADGIEAGMIPDAKSEAKQTALLRPSWRRSGLRIARCVDWHWKLRDIAALSLGNLADTLLVDFVDPDDRVHRQERPPHVLELRFDLLF